MKENSERKKGYWDSIRKHKKIIFSITIAYSVIASIQMLYPWLLMRLIDGAVAGELKMLWLYAGLFIGLTAFTVITEPWTWVIANRVRNRYYFETMYALIRHTLRLSIPFHKGKESTRILNEIRQGVEAGSSILRILLERHFLQHAIAALIALSIVFYYSTSAGIVLVSLIIVLLLLNTLLARKIAKAEGKLQHLGNTRDARVREMFAGIEAVKIFCAEDYEGRWYETQGKKYLGVSNYLALLYGWFDGLSQASNAVPAFIVMGFGVPEVLNGTMSVGELMAVLLWSQKVVGPIGQVAEIYREFRKNLAFLKPMLGILNQEPTVREHTYAMDMERLHYAIEFQDVSFRYPDSELDVLRNVSLTIPAGQKVALVGRTGSGKSTLARLLMRFYDPNSGIITVDGINLQNISFHSLYEEVSYVTQEVAIISDTVLENVRYGFGEFSEGAVKEACARASMGFIESKEKGLLTHVGELGKQLSGGERQRIALARIFLREPSVVILDEATSAMDAITEREVQEAFDQMIALNGGTTAVVIAHRISTVRNADKIVVLDQGEVVDTGTHEELLSRCELYQELCQGMTS